MKSMTGACVPMITPMARSGAVDYDSVESLANHLIKRGCSALYPCGTTGEVMNLTKEERKNIVRRVIAASCGRVPVFAQVGGLATADSVELAVDSCNAGADGIGILTPTYYPLSDHELFRYYVTVSRSVPEDFPVYLYGIPGLAVNRLSIALVEKIAGACKNIVGIKYSVSDILTLMSFKNIQEGRFQVLAAPVQILLPALAVGIEGIVSGNCNIFVEDINRMFALFREKEIEECRRLQGRLTLLAGVTADKEAAKCKALLCRIGVIASDAMRSPQMGLEEPEKEELFSLIDNNYASYSF